jgi:hypothetical protein
VIIETIRKLAKELDSGLVSLKLGEPCFLSKDYRPKPFDVTNFHKIEHNTNHRRIAFVDGGNQLIVETPTLSIHLNRVYFNIFEGAKRLAIRSSKQLFEFFSVTSGSFKNGYPHYKTLIYSIDTSYDSILPDKSKLEFSPRTEITIDDRPILDIPRVSPIARRFAEWSLSKHVVKEFLENGDILVMDGTLKAAFPNESEYSNDCYQLAQSKGIIYTGLAKSSRLFTSTGLSLIGAIMELASNIQLEGVWYYHPIAESLSPKHAAELFIIKLHESSDRIFRYDIQTEQARKMKHDELEEIISQLSVNSADPSFLGYPYGLIDADDNARVRDEEVKSYRLLVLSEISKMGSWQKFLREIQAIDAHEVINFLKAGM